MSLRPRIACSTRLTEVKPESWKKFFTCGVYAQADASDDVALLAVTECGATLLRSKSRNVQTRGELIWELHRAKHLCSMFAA